MDSNIQECISKNNLNFTYDAKGHGLGIAFILKTLQEKGGRILYTSRKNMGTNAKLYLKSSISVGYLLFDFKCDKRKRYIIVDDDTNWLHYFESLLKKVISSVDTFSSIQDFKKFYMSNKQDELFIIIDYQLGEMTGLEVIDNLGLSLQNVIIATDNHKSSKLVHQAELRNIKILPKQLIKYVRIY